MLAKDALFRQGKVMGQWRQTLGLWGFALTKIPMIAFVRPSIIRVDGEECEIRIPLNFWTRNHLKSMYFGTLAVGADVAGGLIAMEAIKRSKKKVQLLFKDFKADFLKRPTADVHFICKDGKMIQRQVQETLKTKKRVNRTLTIVATCPKVDPGEVVAEFKLGLSLKAESK